MIKLSNKRQVGTILITLLLFGGIFGVMPSKLFAANSLSLAVEENEITMEGGTILQLTIEGNENIDSRPEILNSANFLIEENGMSTNVSIINGATSMQKVFTYTIYPKREGELKIGPAKLTLNGKVLVSNEITLKVLAAGTTSSQNSNNGNKGLRGRRQIPNPFDEEENNPSHQSDGANDILKNLKNYCYVEGAVSKDRAYIGEQVVYSFRFYRKINELAGGQLSLPDFSGFLKEPLGDKRVYEKNINGERWEVVEFNMALFPMSEGDMTIGQATLLIDVPVRSRNFPQHSLFNRFFNEGFFSGSMKRVRLQTKPITFHVSPYPLSKPSTFTGVVGHLDIQSEISQSTLKVGESTTLTIKVKSNSKLKDFLFPNLNEVFPTDSFKIYDDKPSVEQAITLDEGVVTTKTFRKAIVPLKKGVFEIAPITFSYLNSKSGKYESIQTKNFTLRVEAGEEKSDAKLISSQEGGVATSSSIQGKEENDQKDEKNKNKRDIQILGKDLMPITHDQNLLFGNNPKIIDHLFFFLSLLLMPTLYMILAFRKRRWDKISGNESFFKRETAFKNFKVNLNKLKVEQQDFFSEFSKVVREYLSSKYGLSGTTFSLEELNTKLQQNKIPDQIFVELKTLLEFCDYAHYGGGASINSTPTKKREMKEKILKIISNLE